MEIEKLLKSVFVKKTANYIYVIFFLIIFSIFIIFAIEPSLRTAFSLKKEETDLSSVDQVYEQQINNITDVQSTIEANRDDLPLLNQSISVQPEVNKIVEDIKNTADKNSLIISKASIVNINLSKTNSELQSIQLVMEGNASFPNIRSFINDLFAQRRLKLVDNVVISQDKQSTGSGNLKVSMTIDGFYL